MTLAAELLSALDYRRYWLGSTAFALGIWAFLLVSIPVVVALRRPSLLRL